MNRLKKLILIAFLIAGQLGQIQGVKAASSMDFVDPLGKKALSTFSEEEITEDPEGSLDISSNKGNYLPMTLVSGLNPELEMYLYDKDQILDFGNKDKSAIRFRIDASTLVLKGSYPTSIKVDLYEYDPQGNKVFLSTVRPTIYNKKFAANLSVQASVGVFPIDYKEVFFDVYDNQGNLVNTYKHEIEAREITTQTVTTLPELPSAECDSSNFAECQLKYILNNVSFEAVPKVKIGTEISKTDDGKYLVSIPIAKRRVEVKRGAGKGANISGGGIAEGNGDITSRLEFGIEDLQRAIFSYHPEDNSAGLSFGNLSGDIFHFTSDGKLGVGLTNPTAFVDIAAGTTTTPSLKLEAGALTTEAQEGAIEFDGSGFYITSNGVRRKLVSTPNGQITDTDVSDRIVITDKQQVISNKTMQNITFVSPLKYLDGRGEGKLMTSDTNGNMIWRQLTSIGGASSAPGVDALTIGYNLTASGTNTISMGKGNSPTDTLNNAIDNSLMIGFNSNAATLFVGPSNGDATTGNVGIGTISPDYKLDVNGELHAQTISSNNFAGNGAGLYNLNASAISHGVLSATYGGTSVANNGGTMTFGANDIVFNGSDITFNATGATNVVLPINGTLATLNGVETFRNKTILSPAISSPTVNGNALFINGARFNDTVRISDGSQGATKLFVSDNAGNGAWIGVEGAITNGGVSINAFDDVISDKNGNLLIGNGAGLFKTTAFENTSTGIDSLYSVTTGSRNAAFGYESLYNNVNGDENVAFGHSALFNGTTGNGNLALGYRAGSTITTGSRNIAIGYGVNVDNGALSDQMNIGNTIFGKLSNGWIAIDHSNPSATLDVGGGSANFIDGNLDLLVAGDAEIDGSIYTTKLLASSSINGAALNISGRAAVGKLLSSTNVNGSYAVFTGNVDAANVLATGQVNGNTANFTTANVSGNLNAGTVNGDTFDGDFTNGSVLFSNATGVLSQNNAQFFWDRENNRLGLGTNAPTTKLDINGRVRIQGGNPVKDYVLASVDGNGLAQWRDISYILNNGGAFLDALNDAISDKTSNIFLGNGSGLSNVSGEFNTGVGINSLTNLTFGNGNTAFGYRSLYNLNNGYNNVALGDLAGHGQISGSNNIFLGNDTNGSSPTASNELNIGNAFFGKLDTKKFGIGVENADASLEIGDGTLDFADGNNDLLVADDIEADGNIYSTNFTASGTINGATSIVDNALVNQTLRANKILTTTNINGASLEISGNATIGGIASVGKLLSSTNVNGTYAVFTGNVDAANVLAAGSVNGTTANFTTANVSGNVNAGTVNGDTFDGDFTNGSILFSNAAGVLSQNNSQLFWDRSNNRLGLGTNTPAAKFDINGTVRIQGGNPSKDYVLASVDSNGLAQWRDISYILNNGGAFLDALNDAISDKTSNLFLGNGSGLSNISGEYNTGLGINSLTNLTFGNGNTAFGYRSLYNLNNGYNNIAIGDLAGHGQTAGNNNIFIGNDTNGSSLTASNELNIGNAIYGNLNNGNIGIAVENPLDFKLQIAGNVGPDADSTYDLGSLAKRFANVFADNLNGASANITTINNTTIFSSLVNATNLIADDFVINNNGNIADSLTIGNDLLVGNTINASTLIVDNAIIHSALTAPTINSNYFNGGSFSGNGLELTHLNANNIDVGVLAAVRGGTSVSNNGGSMTFGANDIVFNGNNISFNATGASNVVLPLTGTLATLANTETFTNKTILADNGTAPAPSFAFDADTDTGMFRAGTDELGLSTAGTEAVRIISDGNVGIGTTAPTSKLDINGRLTMRAGAPAANKVLISLDSNGLADWVSASTLLTNGGAFLDALNDAISDKTSNIFLGNGSGLSNISGEYNTGVGINTLTNLTFGNGNTAYGYRALYNLNNGSNNVAIGDLAGRGQTKGDNNIFIGYDTNGSSATASDELNIGNAIYGDLSSGNIGIAVQNPADFKLQIAGDVGPNANATYDLGSVAKRFANVYANNFNGYTARIQTINADTLYSEIIHNSDIIYTSKSFTNSANGNDLNFTNANLTNIISSLINASTLIADNATINNNATVSNNLTVTNTINGSTFVGDTLTINQNGTIGNNLTVTNTINGTTLIGDNLIINNNGNFANDLYFGHNINGTNAFFDNGTIGNLTLDTLSAHDISVDNGSAADPTLGFNADTNTGIYLDDFDRLGFSTSGTERLLINSAGNIGISVTNPANFKLQIAGNIGPDTDSTYDLGSSTARFANTFSDNFNGATASITTIDGTTANLVAANIGTVNGTTFDGDFTNGSILFSNPAGVLSQNNAQFFWDRSNNRLGLGTNAPTSKLDINGQVTIRGGTPGANKVLVSLDSNGLAHWTTATDLLNNGGAFLNALNDAISDRTSNLFLGNGTGLVSTGQYNTGVGINALTNLTFGNGNTAYGYRALYDLNNGSNNIAIGDLAGHGMTTGSNNIFLGTDVNGSSPTASDELNIGDAIFGDLSSGNIGIAVQTPADFKLQVAGNVGPDADSTYDLGSTAKRFANTYSDNFNGATANITTINNTTIFSSLVNATNLIADDAAINNSATVGNNLTVTNTINGSTLIGDNLIINNNGSFAKDILLGHTINGNNAFFDNGTISNLDVTNLSAHDISVDNGSSANPSLGFNADPNTGIYLDDFDRLGFSTSGTERLLINSAGNIGISVTNPANFKLEVGGDIGPGNGSTYDLGSSAARFANTFSDNFNGATASITTINTSTLNSIDINNSATINTAKLLASGSVNGNTANFVAANIGTVNGTTFDGDFTNGSILFSNPAGVLSQNNAEFFWDRSNNRLGLGTNAPTSKLDINGQVTIRGGTPGANKVLVSLDGNGLAHWTTATDLLNNGGAFLNALNDAISDRTSNLFLGNGTGLASTGQYNTGVGINALTNLTFGNGNTAFGYRAFYELNNGSNNIAIGDLAGHGMTTGTNNIFIGTDVNGSSPTASDELNIGDAIFGDLSSGNIGIAVQTPADFKLQVAGNVGPNADSTYDLGSTAKRFANTYSDNFNGATANITTINNTTIFSSLVNATNLIADDAAINNSATVGNNLTVTNTINGSTFVGDILTINQSGTIGNNLTVTNTINGTTLIGDNLIINNNGNFANDLYFGHTINGTNAFFDNGTIGNLNIGNLSSDDISVNNGTAADPSYGFKADANTGIYLDDFDRLGFSTSGTERLLINSAGNIGISVTNPANFKLEVGGDIGPGNGSTYDLGSSAARFANTFSDNFNGATASITTINTSTLNSIDINNSATINTDKLLASTTINGNTANLVAANIGTVNGTTFDGDFTNGSILFSNPAGVLSQNNAEFFWDRSNNRLGLGTNAPTSKLDINGQVTIRGGSPAAHKVLVSVDGNGLAQWTTATDLLNNGGAFINALNDAISDRTSNLFLGNGTGLVSTGQYNTGVGINALTNLTFGNGNTAYGYRALYNLNNGFNNIAIGDLAGDGTTSGTNNIFIGAGANGSSATASDELNIGDAIYGDLSSGNIGIAVQNPADFKLQVAGNVGPNTDSTYDLGSTAKRFANTYSDNFNGATANITTINNTSLYSSLVNASTLIADNATINQTLSANKILATTNINGASLTISGSTTLSSMTNGSILFAGPSGVVSQNNSNLFWDKNNDVMMLGGNTLATADISFKADGTVVINEQGNASNFRVEGDTNGNLLTTDATNDRVGIKTSVPNSTLHVAGTVSLPITTKSTSYSLTEADYTVMANANGGSFVVSLPSAVGVEGRVYVIKKIDGSVNLVTIQANGVETIDGSTTYSLVNQYESIKIQSDGSNWYIL